MNTVLLADEIPGFFTEGLPMPAWAFGSIAFVTFLVLLGITLSWRGISHRH